MGIKFYNSLSFSLFFALKTAACCFVWNFTSSGYSGFHTVLHTLHSENAACDDKFSVVCTVGVFTFPLFPGFESLVLCSRFKELSRAVGRADLVPESSASVSSPCVSSPVLSSSNNGFDAPRKRNKRGFFRGSILGGCGGEDGGVDSG